MKSEKATAGSRTTNVAERDILASIARGNESRNFWVSLLSKGKWVADGDLKVMDTPVTDRAFETFLSSPHIGAKFRPHGPSGREVAH